MNGPDFAACFLDVMRDGIQEKKQILNKATFLGRRRFFTLAKRKELCYTILENILKAR